MRIAFADRSSVLPAILLALLIAFVPSARAEDTGACCNPTTGTCTVTTQADCTGGNVWMGPGTTCIPNPCPNCLSPACNGICCLPDGSCQYTFKPTCDQENGTYYDNSTCQPNPCTTSSVPAPLWKNPNWGRIKSRYL